MRIVLKNVSTAHEVAYWYWFLENLKYGISLFFFSSLPHINILFTGVASVALFLLVASLGVKNFLLSRKPLILPREIKLLGIFYLMAGISLLWSTHPFFTFSLWANLLLDALTFFLICQLGQIDQIIQKSLQGFIHGALITTVITLILNPLESTELNRLGQFGLLDAVRLGNILALASLFLLYYLLCSKHWKQRCMILAQLSLILYGFIFTLYKAGTAALLLSIFTLVLLYPNPIRAKIKFVIISIAMAVIIFFGSYQRILSYTGLFEGQMLSTFSGRTIIWETAWDMVKENPFLGFGAGGAVSSERMTLVDANFGTIERQTHAHNEWLNMWVQYGLHGLLLTIYIYGSFLFRLTQLRKREKEVSALCLALFLYYMIRTPFESILVGLLIPETLFILLIFWSRQAASTTKIHPNTPFPNLLTCILPSNTSF